MEANQRQKLLDAWEEYESQFSSKDEARWEIPAFAVEYANKPEGAGLSSQEIEEEIYDR